MNNKLVKGITFGGNNTQQPVEEINPYIQAVQLYEEGMLENIDVRRNNLANPFTIQALDKVKQLVTLPDGYCTTKMVAEYFEVPIETIKTMIKRNREELELNGLIVLTGDDLKQWKEDGRFIMNLPSDIIKSSVLTLYNRRTILNIAMLLRDSIIAKAIRYVILNALDTEEGQNLMLLETQKAMNDRLMQMQESMNNMSTQMTGIEKEVKYMKTIMPMSIYTHDYNNEIEYVTDEEV